MPRGNHGYSWPLCATGGYPQLNATYFAIWDWRASCADQGRSEQASCYTGRVSTAATCILCPNTLRPDEKPEHVWLKALGGRKTTRRALCSTCNALLGSGPDKALADSVAFLRNLMNFPDAKGNAPPALRGRRSGEHAIALEPGGVPVLDRPKPFRITELPDGNANVDLCVTSAEQLRQIIPDLARALRMDEDKVKAMLRRARARRITQRVGTQHFGLSLGGSEAMRSMMKTCLTLWADRVGSAELQQPAYDDAKRFAREGDADLVAKLTRITMEPLDGASALETAFGSHFNLACVASDTAGRVAGYFRLYNTCAWQFRLCEEGGHPSCIVGVVSNPADPRVWQEFRSEEWVSYRTITQEPKAFDPAFARSSLVGMLQTHHDQGSEREISRICSQVSAKMGLAPDSPMSREQVESYVHEVSRRLACWMTGMPLEEPLSAEDIAAILEDEETPR